MARYVGWLASLLATLWAFNGWGFLTVLLPLARLSLATYTAALRIKTLNSLMLDPYLRNLPLCPLESRT